jgi:hypothetical protein
VASGHQIGGNYDSTGNGDPEERVTIVFSR